MPKIPRQRITFCRGCGKEMLWPKEVCSACAADERGPPEVLPAAPVVVPARALSAQRSSRTALNLGITSLALGGAALLLCWVPLVGAISVLVGAVAALFGLGGLALVVRDRGSEWPFALGGLVISGIAITVSVGVQRATFDAIVDVAKTVRDFPRTDVLNTPVPIPGLDDGPQASDEELPEDVPEYGLREAAHVGRLSVSAIDPTIGRVPLENDPGGSPRVSVGDLLMIDLLVTNTSETMLHDYRPLGGGLGSYGPSAALRDDLGNTYKRIRFGVTDVLGAAKPDTIRPGRTLRDRLVFELPVERAGTFTLTLPVPHERGSTDVRIVFALSDIRDRRSE